jgi:hypothetical protein
MSIRNAYRCIRTTFAAGEADVGIVQPILTSAPRPPHFPQDSYHISPENRVVWAVAARTLQAFSRREVTEMLEHAAIREPDGKIASATTVKRRPS